MTKEFIPYQQGLQLKELGFDEPCWAWWHIEDCDTRFCYSEQRSPIINSRETEIVGLPTYSQAFKWFRDKHGLGHTISGKGFENFLIYLTNKDGIIKIVSTKTYEEAELACLTKLIEIIDAEIKNRR